MKKCVNINSPEFKSLLKETNLPSFKLSSIIGVLSENKSEDYFPSLEEVKTYIENQKEANLSTENENIVNRPNLTELANQSVQDINEYNRFTKSQTILDRGGTRADSALQFIASSKFKDMKNPTLNLGRPSEILLSIGVPDLPISVLLSYFQSHILDNPEHRVSAKQIEEIMRAIHNPIAAYKNKEQQQYGRTNRIELLTSLKNQKGENIVVILEIEKVIKDGYDKIFQQQNYRNINTINTAFAVSNLSRLNLAIDSNNLIYINKERIKDALQSGATTPSVVNSKVISDSNTKIIDILEKTKDFKNPTKITEIKFNLSQDASQLNLLNTDKWFNQVIIPVLNKMSNLFPQIKYEIISENNLEGLSPEVRNKIENIKSKGFNITSFFLNGKVYVIRERVTKDIAIEEFLHPFINALEKDNPELYKSLLLEAKKLFPELKEQIFKDYKDIYDSVFDLNREFLTQVLSKIMGSQEEYSPEVQSWFDKFVNWIKQLFKSLSNSKQLQNYNIQDIDKNISLNELAILLSKEGTVFNNISIEINNSPQWNISEDRAKEYLSYAKNNLQKEAIENIVAKTHNIIKIPTENGHSYQLLSEEGNILNMKGVTSLSSPEPYTGNKALGRLGTTIHLIADLINTENRTSFSDEDIEDIITKTGLAEFSAAYRVKPEYQESTFKGGNPDKELATYITKNITDYLLGLKQKGSVLLTETVLGDPETLIAGTADIIEITKEGKYVIHDFKSMRLFLKDTTLYKPNKGYSSELTIAGQEAINNAWNSDKRQISFTRQQSLYKALLAKIVETNVENIEMQIVPIVYQGIQPSTQNEQGEYIKIDDQIYINYVDNVNQIFFPIQTTNNSYNNVVEIDEESSDKYKLKYDRAFVMQQGIKVPKIPSQEEIKRDKDLSELSRIQNSEKFNDVINDLFIQVNKIVLQYGNSNDEVKKEIYKLFTQGDDNIGDIASIKTAIEVLYKDIQAGVDVQETAVKFAQLLNYMNETFIGIENIKSNFIIKLADKSNNILDSNEEIYKHVSDLRVLYQFAKSFDPIISTISLELDDTSNDNIFKQMVSKAKSDISKIEQLYQDNIIPLLSRGLELQISPETRENVSKEINARIAIEQKYLSALPPDDPSIPNIKDRINKLEKQLELMIPNQTILSKMIKGEYGDASLLWSNLIANINNPDMIIATATKILGDVLVDLNTESNRVFNAYGRQLDNIIKVKGDKRKDVKSLYKDMLYSVKRIVLKQDGSTEEWFQKHIITDIDENVYYEYDKRKIALELAKKSGDLKAIEKARIELKEFEKRNFEPKLTEEAEKVLNSLDVTFTETIDGKTISKNPKEIIDALFKQIKDVTSTDTREDILQGHISEDKRIQLEQLWMEYSNLSSDYDFNGNLKSSIDKKVAEVVRERKEKLDALRKGEPNTKLWEKYRQQQIQRYGEESTQLKEWDAYNSVIQVDPTIYERRDELLAEIKAITDKYKNDSRIHSLEVQNQNIWKEIFQLSKSYRKQGILQAEKIPDTVKQKIKDLEEQTVYNQKQIKSLTESISSKEDKKALKAKYQELQQLFITQPIERYYVDKALAIAELKSEEGIDDNTKITNEDYLYDNSDWFRNNHIRVEKELQSGEIQIEYKPTYYYRQNKATDTTKNKLVPAKQYWQYTLPENPNYLDMFGRRTLKKSSIYYRPEHYKKLERGTTSKDKVNFETVKFLRERAENFQKDLHQSNQIGYAVPTLRKSTWDRLMEGSMLKSFKNFKAEVFKTAQDRDEGIYENDATIITDLAGEETKFIPVKYTSKIEEEEQSYDVFKGFFMYEMSARKATMLEKQKGFFEALEEQLVMNTPKRSDAVEAITKGLSNRFKQFGIEIERPKGTSNERADSINDLINRVFYDEYKKDWFKTKLFGKEGLTLTDTKIVDKLLGFAGSRMMFMNAPNWVVNMVSGNIQSILESTSGRYMKKEDLLWAKSQIPKHAVDALKDRSKFKDLSYFTQMSRYFNYAQGSYENELGEKLSWTEFTQGTSELFYSGKIFGEWEMQTANFLAMMKAKKVYITKDGEKKMISFWEAFESSEDGVPKLKEGVTNIKDEPITDQDIKDYMRKIQGLNKMLNGAYSQFDQLKAEKYSFVRALTFMRKYFVPLFVNRFGKSRTDLELGDIREGYYITTYQLLKEWLTLGRSLITRYKEGNLTELQKQNLTKMGMELIILASFSIIVALLTVLGADDDDELKYARFLTNKVRREFVSTVPLPFFGIQEFYSVFASPVIAIGQIGQGAKFFDQVIKLPLNVASQGQWFEDDLYYQKDSGVWEKGDSKVLATLLKLAGIKTNIFSPDELEKAYENQIRWK